MEQLKIITSNDWKIFYKLAGVMAILIAVVGMVDAITSNLGAEAVDNGSVAIAEWFSLFQTNRFFAFSSLGMVNIITLSLGIPVYIALAHVFSPVRQSVAALAAIVFFIGVAVYLASNTVLPLYTLSDHYALACGAHETALEAAGLALLVQGADLTPGTFIAFALTQTAGLCMTWIMLNNNLFGKWIGWIGLLGYSMTSVFFCLAAFTPDKYGTAMAFAMPGGFLLVAYQVLLALKFFQLGK